MIRGIFIINNHGASRLTKCYDKLVRATLGDFVQCTYQHLGLALAEGRG